MQDLKISEESAVFTKLAKSSGLEWLKCVDFLALKQDYLLF